MESVMDRFDEHPQALGSSSEPSPPNPWTFVNDRLYGRWRYAIPLSVIFALAGGVTAFLVAPVRYAATGHVYVAPFIEPVIGDEHQTIPMHDAFVEAQAQLLQMDSLLDRAYRSATARGAGVHEEFPDIKSFREALTVSRDRRSTYIAVVVESKTPPVGFAAVKSILEEYERESAPEAKYQARRDELIQFIEAQRSRIRGLKAQRMDAPGRFVKYPDEMLDDLRQFNWNLYTSHILSLITSGYLVSVSDSMAKLSDGDGGLATESEPKSGSAGTAELKEPTLAHLIQIDPDFGRARQQLIQEETTLTQMLSLYSETHRPVRLQRAAVESLRARVAEMERHARERWLAAASEGIPGQTEATGVISPQRAGDLQIASASLWKDIEEIAAEVRRREQIDHEIQALERGLVDLEKNLENLRYNERALKQGYTSVRMPIMPEVPQRSKRNQLAAAGVMLGFGLPFGLFLLVGHFDRRAFAASQLAARSGLQDCIGVLPDLSRGENHVETRELAAACIHRLRNRIEMNRLKDGSMVLAVTSPFQGDGKTSLAFALGWSYANSGLSTCLVDCDFIGQSLTAQVGQLDARGVKELLATTSVNGEARPLPGNPRLSIIGVGRDRSIGPEHVTRTDMKRLMERLRTRFDIVIIDTGPLLGSVESLPVVAAADAVVLTLRRGRPSRRLEECQAELRSVDTHLLGVVLNCAELSECRRYTSASRVSERSAAQGDESSTRDTRPQPGVMVQLLTDGRTGEDQS